MQSYFLRGLCNQAAGARLAINHSTHIPGLIPVLERLAASLPAGRVTPGIIARCRPSHERRLQLKVGSSPIGGGFRLTARKGTTVQEVLVGCNSLTLEALKVAVSNSLERRRPRDHA